LLLLTNDGDLAFSLTHPSHEIEKEYHVETDSPFSAQEEQRLYAGIGLNGKNYRFHRIQRIGDCRYRVILKQGLKRQIRLMAKSVGKKVLNLKRVRIGGLELGDLPEGQWRHLTLEEINLLKK
jgi:23S rRNA pseudouridine2605 synthase